MSKELPFFKFNATQWLTGNINYETYHTQGVFIKACAEYWNRSNDLTIDDLNLRINEAETIKYLIEKGYLKMKGKKLVIKFLDEEREDISTKRLKLSEAGRKGGLSSAEARLNQGLSIKNKNKEEERKEVFGVLSLEATAGEFATQLLSYYCKNKFINIKDREERVRVMGQPEVAAKAKELFEYDNGSPSFLLCDDRGADLDDVEVKIEEMVRSMGITVLIIDVTSDLFSGVENSRQEAHMTFQKKLAKETGISIINVCHTRKSPTGDKDKSRGAEISDSDIIGSSTLVKSASVVIGLLFVLTSVSSLIVSFVLAGRLPRVFSWFFSSMYSLLATVLPQLKQCEFSLPSSS